MDSTGNEDGADGLTPANAAVSLPSSALVEELQRAYRNLELAYDTTIEGWSRALDLRDRMTEAHSLRVTEMTMTLGRALGVDDAELVHMRRGALLHDIGKMGIPDAILTKPGPLTDAEWAMMRLHPVFAYELLSPIAYLQAAMDIPHSHHERWDGSGYPRGLSGEQIPFSARVFAVIDVWDALTSARPYREAWPHDKARAYIESATEIGFDPKIVAAFLPLI